MPNLSTIWQVPPQFLKVISKKGEIIKKGIYLLICRFETTVLNSGCWLALITG
jgi:hypothetical protein